MTDDSDDARDAVNRLFEATNAHDVDSLTRCFADEYLEPVDTGDLSVDEAVASVVGDSTSD